MNLNDNPVFVQTQYPKNINFLSYIDASNLAQLREVLCSHSEKYIHDFTVSMVDVDFPLDLVQMELYVFSSLLPAGIVISINCRIS